MRNVGLLFNDPFGYNEKKFYYSTVPLIFITQTV